MVILMKLQLFRFVHPPEGKRLRNKLVIHMHEKTQHRRLRLPQQIQES